MENSLISWLKTANLWILGPILALVYFLAAKLGLSLAFSYVGVSPVWPPTGIALASIYLLGYRVWPAILIGAFSVNFSQFWSSDLSISLALFGAGGISVGNTLEAVIGIYLVRRFVTVFNMFDNIRSILGFLALAGFLGTMISATVGVTSLFLIGEITLEIYGYIWWTWWLGDWSGALIVTPLLIACAQFQWKTYPLQKILESLFFFVALIGVVGSIFGNWLLIGGKNYPLEYLSIPFILWGTFRLGRLGAAFSVVLVAGVATWGTVAGYGPFVRDSINESLLLLQGFLGILSIMSLILSATLEKSKQLEQAQRINNERLEEKVSERTFKLGESLSLLRATLESTADGILLVDNQGNMLEMNQKFVEMWKLPPNLVEQKNDEKAMQFVLDQLLDPDAFLSKIQDLYRNSESESFDVLELKNDRMFERFSIPVRMEGKSVGRVWSFRDVSERWKAEERRQNLESQLRHSQKMEAIGTLAGGVAHDFNNILAIISGNVELCMMAMPNDDTNRGAMEHISVATKRATNLVKQILTFSRLEMVSFKPLELSVVVAEALDMIRATIPTHIEIARKLPKNSPLILADLTQIHQIILNLCTNAYHAMEETGGTIEICLEVLHAKIDKKHNKERWLKLTVHDSGCGISLEDQERIFDPFYTTKDVGKGTGLGLSVVHGIVEEHKGKIDVVSERGKGTTFSIFFPIIDEVLAQRSSVSVEDTHLVSGQILVAEDEPALGKLYRNFLQSNGYQVTVCSNASEALSLFKKDQNHFDLVLTDQAMPMMTGQQLVKELLILRPDLPVILSTGYSSAIDENRAYELGFKRFFMKPVELSELQKAINECLSS